LNEKDKKNENKKNKKNFNFIFLKKPEFLKEGIKNECQIVALFMG